MKIIKIFLWIFIFTMTITHAYGLEIFASYGESCQGSKMDSSTRVGNIYLREPINQYFFHQLTMMYLYNTPSNIDDPTYKTPAVFYGAGIYYKLGKVEITTSLSLGYLFKPDKEYLGGSFPQFNEVVMLNILDDTLKQSLGIALSHVSSAGLAGANHGRDLLSFIMGYRF